MIWILEGSQKSFSRSMTSSGTNRHRGDKRKGKHYLARMKWYNSNHNFRTLKISYLWISTNKFLIISCNNSHFSKILLSNRPNRISTNNIINSRIIWTWCHNSQIHKYSNSNNSHHFNNFSIKSRIIRMHYLILKQDRAHKICRFIRITYSSYSRIDKRSKLFGKYLRRNWGYNSWRCEISC
jgi:hypothetical protein